MTFDNAFMRRFATNHQKSNWITFWIKFNILFHLSFSHFLSSSPTQFSSHSHSLDVSVFTISHSHVVSMCKPCTIYAKRLSEYPKKERKNRANERWSGLANWHRQAHGIVMHGTLNWLNFIYFAHQPMKIVRGAFFLSATRWVRNIRMNLNPLPAE